MDDLKWFRDGFNYFCVVNGRNGLRDESFTFSGHKAC